MNSSQMLACFTCMSSSDPSLNNATSNAILVMLGVVALPMLGFLALVIKIGLRQRALRRAHLTAPAR